MNAKERERLEGKDDIGSIDESDKGHRHHHHHHHHHRPKTAFRLVLIMGIIILAMGLVLAVVCRSIASIAFLVDSFSNLLIFCGDYAIITEKRRNVDEYTKIRRRAITNMFSSVGLLVGGTVVGCIAILRLFSKSFALLSVKNEHLLLTFATATIIVVAITYFLIYRFTSVTSSRLFHYLKVTIIDCILLTIGMLIITLVGNHIVDSITAIAICIVIVYNVCKNFLYIISIIVNDSNKDEYYSGLTRELLALPGVKKVHHLHVWTCHKNKCMLVCHVYTDELITEKFSEELTSMIKGICADNGIDYECVQIMKYEGK